jgi:hypothetical protein
LIVEQIKKVIAIGLLYCNTKMNSTAILIYITQIKSLIQNKLTLILVLMSRKLIIIASTLFVSHVKNNKVAHRIRRRRSGRASRKKSK